MPLLLENKTILVTGAGSGLGKEMSIAYAKQGATVLLLGKSLDKLNQTYDQIVEKGYITPVIVPLNLETLTESQVTELALIIENQCSGLNGILHCASRFVPLGPLSSQHVDQWKNAFNCNVFGAFALTKGLIHILEQAHDASVIFTIEHHGLTLPPLWGGFGLTQNTVLNLMQLFAREYQNNLSIRFNLIAPGPIATPMRIRTHPGEINQDQRPASLLIEPFLYWMSDASRGRTGEIIELNNYTEGA
ncbi:SDR family NAD(P)-dependent oxidoreductase [Ferrovum sp. PN-J185]|uniref:SDR family NAD(P)-dependent oxidoreductase n=1 Tax=Ferrovum sp. PN-J185 TaxID=1356306 RepID=UPI0007965080|nr:SDR family NAD(P)-dependent oxidoreductase [Ferrovum sp. PN-J185]KXW56960.1 putative oxidoreductase YciK [Ferrovum sp. PN-J185]MCC6069167.1 SDR family NAD(P)-dependent oxidoreductase [Ferrovum sp. PN-J185]MDE1892381.1 SDR family NAD(P)-dependent oxidoreductase [Betaproteobacteria bacterium]MDE2057122.1 SDR family NAD(P)-dependent oxidoreductase [Betaproteobacteria bacterium]